MVDPDGREPLIVGIGATAVGLVVAIAALFALGLAQMLWLLAVGTFWFPPGLPSELVGSCFLGVLGALAARRISRSRWPPVVAFVVTVGLVVLLSEASMT